jgi:hypothetical protein
MQPTTVAPTKVGATRVLAPREPRLQGDDVRAVQQRLLGLGYNQVGTVDGIFGPQTELAVRAFQQTNRLPVDGIVGPQTRAQLFSPQAATAVIPIVVYDGSTFLLGGVQAQTWLEAPAAASLLTGGERYRVLAPDQAVETTAVGSTPVEAAPSCSEFYTVRLEPVLSSSAVVAVGGDWQLQPRQPRALATNNAALQHVVVAFLQSKGIAHPRVQIESALTVDLESDGSDEVVLTATRLATQEQDPTNAAAGDYSLVAVQKTVNGTPTLIELNGNYFPQGGDFVAPYEYRVLGVLEIVVNGAYYEGAYTSAFGIEGTTARTLLTSGCGV